MASNAELAAALAPIFTDFVAEEIDEATFLSQVTAALTEWNGGYISNVEVAAKLGEYRTKQVLFIEELRNWLIGPADGGWDATGVTPGGGYYPMSVGGVAVYIQSPAKILSQTQKGDPGADAGIRLLFSNQTSDADPGNGTIRLNNATLASVTMLYVDALEQGGSNIGTWITSMDDANASAIRGQIIIREAGTAKFAVFDVTGAVTTATGYYKIPVSYKNGGGGFTNGATMFTSFTYAGPVGPSGTTLRSGTGVPSNGVGVDGEFFVSTDLQRLYGPKTSGAWGAYTDIQGGQGDPGTDGTQLRYGTGAPVDGIGVNGEFYIATDLKLLYGPKTGGTWPGSPVDLEGAQGDPGLDGATHGVVFEFSTTTTNSDPGNGVVRFNNATVASVTSIYFDNLSGNGTNVTAWLDSFDDSTSDGVQGQLVFNEVGSDKFAIFNVNGIVQDGTGFRRIPVVYVSGVLPTNGADVGVIFTARGDRGTDGLGAGDVVGPSSSVSGHVALFDSGDGKSLQDGGALATVAFTGDFDDIQDTPTTVAGYGITDAVKTSGTQSVGGDKTFSDNVIINGNLTVNGSVVSLETTNVEIADAIFGLAKGNSGGTVPYAGIKAERGSNDAFWVFDESVDKWRAFTSNNDLTSQTAADISANQLESTVATGTAPLVVASTTKVTNLNCDLLDGHDSAYLLDFGNATGKPTTLSGYGITDGFSLAGGHLTGDLNYKASQDIASASTTNLGSIDGNIIRITGTTTISSFGTADAGTIRNVRLNSALTLVHSANLILPGNANISGAANDQFIAQSEGGGIWRILVYQRANGKPVVALTSGDISGLGSLATLSSVSLTSNVSGTLPVANGGTGGTSQSTARTALGIGTVATRAYTKSTSSPSGGSDGDLWDQYT